MICNIVVSGDGCVVDGWMICFWNTLDFNVHPFHDALLPLNEYFAVWLQEIYK